MATQIALTPSGERHTLTREVPLGTVIATVTVAGDAHDPGPKKLWGNRRRVGIIVGDYNRWTFPHDPS